MRPAVALAGLVVALVASAMLGVLAGAVAVDPRDVLAALIGRADAPTAAIILELRLPRVIAAALVGGALGVAGALLQGLLRNPLADPYVTGTSAGAALGSVAAVAAGGPALLTPLAAFVGALGSVAVIWRLARIGGRTTVLTVLLAGIVISSFAGAAVTLLIVASDRLSLRLRAVLDVLVGGVTSRGSAELVVAAAIVAIATVLALALARRLDAYAFGEETAATLGVDTEDTTRSVLVVTALLTGAAVALAGLVSFVGLVIPHALRPLVGARHVVLVPACLLGGATALVLADLGARIALAPAELPVGVITGLVGAPFFLLVLARSARSGA